MKQEGVYETLGRYQNNFFVWEGIKILDMMAREGLNEVKFQSCLREDSAAE